MIFFTQVWKLYISLKIQSGMEIVGQKGGRGSQRLQNTGFPCVGSTFVINTR